MTDDDRYVSGAVEFDNFDAEKILLLISSNHFLSLDALLHVDDLR